MRFKVDIHEMKYFTQKEKERQLLAAEYIELEANSDEYWEEALEVWQTCTCKWVYGENGRRIPITFIEYKELILSGADRFNKEKDGDLDLRIEAYRAKSRTLGYTYPNTFWIWVNRKYMDYFHPNDLAGHNWHEYHHNIGMDHPGTDRRSVVYKMGNLMDKRVEARIKGLPSLPSKPAKAPITRYRRTLWSRIRSFFSRKY